MWFLNLIINDIVGFEEEETIEFWWRYVKKKVNPTAESCTGGKIAVLTSIRASEYFKEVSFRMLRRLK
jgi:hypothetical protein